MSNPADMINGGNIVVPKAHVEAPVAPAPVVSAPVKEEVKVTETVVTANTFSYKSHK